MYGLTIFTNVNLNRDIELEKLKKNHRSAKTP